MKHSSKYLRALPLAAALLLGGCDASPLEVASLERGRVIRIEDEPELEVWLIRPATPDTLDYTARAER